MYVFPKTAHYWLQQSRKYGTTCCIAALFHNSVCCCYALLHFITTWQQELNSLRRSFSLKVLVQSSKTKNPKNISLMHYKVIHIKRQLYGKYYIKNVAIQKWLVKVTSTTRVWPVKSTIRPDIVRWPAVILSPEILAFLKTHNARHPGLHRLQALGSLHFFLRAQPCIQFIGRPGQAYIVHT